MLIDDNICKEYKLPFEHVKEVLQDTEAVDYFHTLDVDKKEPRLWQKFAYHMQQKRVNHDHIDTI